MQVLFQAEANVGTYNIEIDGNAPVVITPASDGTATYDLGQLNLSPGTHTIIANACNASGCSDFCTAVSFDIPVPVPGVPVITIQ